MGPLSRKARVKQWKSNGKIAVSMCDHYGVEAQKKNHGGNEQNRLYGAKCRDCGRCIWASVRHTGEIE